ncbi:MAG: hypothetical protein WCO56_25640 [Verrucomicrobiota bacterium]
MNPSHPPSLLDDSPSATLRLIQRSRRCFWLGLVGLVPFLGLIAAGQASRLFWQIAAETGEPLRKFSFYVAWALGWSVMEWLVMLDFPGSALVILVFLAIVQLGALAWLRRIRPARRWNPARVHLYWGLAMAHSMLLVIPWLILVIMKANTEWFEWR